MDEKTLTIAGTNLTAHLPQDVPVVRLGVSGSSMAGLLKPGDRIECKPVIHPHISCGDIVVYRNGSQLVVHRVVRKIQNHRGYSFLTRGDSQFQSDGLIGENQILAKVVAVLRKDGKRIDLGRTKPIILNRIAGCYGRLLHYLITDIRPMNLPLTGLLPFPLHFKRLTQMPFQILATWMR